MQQPRPAAAAFDDHRVARLQAGQSVAVRRDDGFHSLAQQFHPTTELWLITTARLDSAWGQIGVMAKTSAPGLMMGPPAESE